MDRSSVVDCAERCGKAWRKAQAFLNRNMIDELESFSRTHRDIAYYFKAPCSLLVNDGSSAGHAERKKKAAAVLDIAHSLMPKGGEESSNAVYAKQYPTYPAVWIALAALRTGNTIISKASIEYLDLYLNPDTLSGTVIKKYDSKATDNVYDLFETSALGYVAFSASDITKASRLADTVLKIIDLQPQLEKGVFLLRWNERFELIENGQPQVFYSVERDSKDQLFFMLGLPLLLLALLWTSTKEERFKSGTERILRFCQDCKHIYKSLASHKVARACSHLATTGHKEAAIVAVRIMEHFLAEQKDDGSLLGLEAGMDCFDQTAEMVVWFSEIQRDLEVYLQH